MDQELVRTILSQSHLCPINPFLKPVIWNHDQAMTLTRLPHFLIISEGFTNQFDFEFGGKVDKENEREEEE